MLANVLFGCRVHRASRLFSNGCEEPARAFFFFCASRCNQSHEISIWGNRGGLSLLLVSSHSVYRRIDCALLRAMPASQMPNRWSISITKPAHIYMHNPLHFATRLKDSQVKSIIRLIRPLAPSNKRKKKK